MSRTPVEHLPALDPASPPKYFVDDDGFIRWDRGPARLAEWVVFSLGLATPSAIAFELMREKYSTCETPGSVCSKLRRLIESGRVVKLGRGLYAHKINAAMFE